MAAKNTGFVLSLHVCSGGTRVELMSLSTASFTSTCHIKRGKHCVEPKQFSGLTRQDNRETPCELRYSFPVLPSVFTPASVNNLWRPWISQRHNSPTLLFTAWGHALQQTPPLHTLMTAEAAVGCRHTTKWCVGRWKAPSRALKVYKKGAIKVSEKAG